MIMFGLFPGILNELFIFFHFILRFECELLSPLRKKKKNLPLNK